MCVYLHFMFLMIEREREEKLLLELEQKNSSELGKIYILWLKHQASAA